LPPPEDAAAEDDPPPLGAEGAGADAGALAWLALPLPPE